MEKIYIKDLIHHLDDEIIDYFIVTQKEMREGTKSQFIRLRLADKSGNVVGNIWNNAKHFRDQFAEGDIVKVKGVVVKFKEQLQITVNKIRKASDNEYDLADFIPTTDKDLKSLSDALFYYIDGVNDKHIKELLRSIFEDKEFFSLFAKAPAAKSWHHNYVGGLLEHTVSVTKICDFASKMYPVQSDVLIAGALLHDIGKVFEYSIKASIDFTTMGRLIGHICLGDQFVAEKASAINNFPSNTLMKIRHLILSHHGEYEKAAARLPQMVEAIVLHYADNLDAQTVGVNQLVQSAMNAGSEWSEYDRLNNRYFYLG